MSKKIKNLHRKKVRLKYDTIDDLTDAEKAGIKSSRHLNGAKAEKNMGKYFNKEFGYQQVNIGKDFTKPTARGIDGIFVENVNGKKIYHFVESKNYGQVGKRFDGLGYNKKLGDTKTMGRQMSDQWIKADLQRIINKGGDEATAAQKALEAVETGRFQKHVFIMNSSPNPRGFTIRSDFAADLILLC